MNRVDPDITWFMSQTVDQMNAVRAVIEAAREARLPIEAMLRAHGQPNTTIAELLVRVENLLAAEGVE